MFLSSFIVIPLCSANTPCRVKWPAKENTLALKPESQKAAHFDPETRAKETHSVPDEFSTKTNQSLGTKTSQSLSLSKLRDWNLANSHPENLHPREKKQSLKKPYLSPEPAQFATAFSHPSRGSHPPGFFPPNKSLEWGLGEDLSVDQTGSLGGVELREARL